jgi:hypothetical protein
MYAWIWRHLPFGLPGKIGGSVALITAAVLLLWFVVFRAIEPWVSDVLLPFDEGQLVPGADTVDPDAVDPAAPGGDDGDAVIGEDGEPLDEFDIPYSTDENNTSPNG